MFELAMAASQRDYYLLERDLDEAVERNQRLEIRLSA